MKSTTSGTTSAPRPQGVWTALATPFRDDAVDRGALARLVEAQVEAGVAGLCPCGTTGESPTVSDAEFTAIVTTVVEAARGRVPVFAGTGGNDTRRSVERTRTARAAGATGALAVSPYYNRPTQEGLYRHFRAMADEGGLPLMLYHIPSRTGGSIEVETVARLAGTGGIVALKEAHGSVDRVTRLREACAVPILSGDDALTLPFLSLGAVGVVSVASNVAPAEVVALVEHGLAGRRDAALSLHERLAPLVRALFLETNPAPVKAALHLLGLFPTADVRLPLVSASPPVVSALRESLRTVPRPLRSDSPHAAPPGR